MNRQRLGALLLLSALAASLFGVGAPHARAGQIVNGDFSNGLNGWTVTNQDFVRVVDGHAVIDEAASTADSDVGFYQDFLVPDDAGTLGFSLKVLGIDPRDGSPAVFIPTGFNVSLLDPSTGGSLVSPAVDFTEAFYVEALTDDVAPLPFPWDAAPGVTLAFSAGSSTPSRVTLDISQFRGKEARLDFRFVLGQSVDFDQLRNASVTIDDVELTSGPPVASVPEPSTLISAGTGALGGCLIVLVRRRRRRAA